MFSQERFGNNHLLAKNQGDYGVVTERTQGGTIMALLVFLISGGFFAYAIGGGVGVAIFAGIVAVLGVLAAIGNALPEQDDKNMSNVAAPAATGVAAGYVVTTYEDDSSMDDSDGGFDFGF